jgi:hypothetical protein
MPQVVVEMSAKEARLWRAQQKIIAQQVKMEQGYKRTGDAARRSGQEAARGSQQAATGAAAAVKGIQSIATGLLGAQGVYMAVNRVNQAYEVWRANMAEIAAEASKASDEILAFTALQEGGTRAKRVETASALATAYGVGDRGEAFATVQAMQSMTGSFEKGMVAAENIFAASQVGIPVALGRELETLGIGQKMDPGELLKLTLIAGQASGRDPEALALAGSGMKFFEDKAFGMALASQLAGTIRKREMPTYSKRAGEALGDTSALMPWFEERGLGEGASQYHRLRALAGAGITTQADFAKIGLTEKVQAEALASVVPLIGEIDKVYREIPRRATDDIFLRMRADIEAEQPWMKQVRETAILQSRQADEMAFGKSAGAALARERAETMRGTALTEMGMRQAFWSDLQDEEGRTSEKGLVAAGLHRTYFGKGDPDRTWGQWAGQTWWQNLPGIKTYQRARRAEEFGGEYVAREAAMERDLAASDPAGRIGEADAARQEEAARRRAAARRRRGSGRRTGEYLPAFSGGVPRPIDDAADRLADAADKLDRAGQRIEQGRVGLGRPDRDR